MCGGVHYGEVDRMVSVERGSCKGSSSINCGQGSCVTNTFAHITFHVCNRIACGELSRVNRVWVKTVGVFRT